MSQYALSSVQHYMETGHESPVPPSTSVSLHRTGSVHQSPMKRKVTF